MNEVRHIKVGPEKEDAVLRLLKVACGDTGQSRRVAAFLLAWWDAESCGGFDITEAWGLDAELARDVVTVFALAVCSNSYPDKLGYAEQFKKVVRAWRPQLAED